MDTPVFDLAWVGAVIGFFLPLVTSAVKQQTWGTQAKRVLALVIAAIAGVVNVGVQAGWEFASAGDFIQLAVFSVVDVYVAAAVVYRNFWEDTKAETSLAAIGS